MSGFMDEKTKKKLLDRELKMATESSEEVGNLSDEERMEKIASFNSGFKENPYPSPFLNLSDMQLPQSTIEVFKWCKYYYTFDPLISGAINALATFPVTEIHLEDDEGKSKEKNDNVKLYEKILFKTLNIYKLCIEIGIDYFLYGNCFVMGEFTNSKKGEKEWANMIRLDPSRMIIDYNPATGSKKYRWQVPQKIKDIVLKKSPIDEYNKIPELIKEAVRNNKTILLNPEQVYHFSRATDSMGDNSVWGVPLVANVLKLLMYRNVLRQAQEAIAREHIVPMRIYYLDRTNTMNVHADFNKVAVELASEIKKSVKDPNHKVVSPIPVNVINVGGEGRGLLLAPEIEQVQSEILAGMNVPREFIFGGVSYSGSSISLRILENQFITYRLLLKDFLQNFVIRKMAKARGEWTDESDDETLLTVKLADLKMQDDVQQKQLIVQLNSAGKCSNDYLWKSLGIDADKMKEALEKEALEALELESKAQAAKMKHELEIMDLKMQLQAKEMQMQMQLQMMQMQMQEQMNPQQNMQEQQPQGQVNEKENNQNTPDNQNQQTQSNNEQAIESEIQNIALQLSKVGENERQAYINKLPIQVKNKVVDAMENLVAQQQVEANKSSVDMRPMPEQKPPRRK